MILIVNFDKVCREYYVLVYYSYLTVIYAVWIAKVITSDQGSEFNNHLDKKLMKMMKIDHHLTTPYHPLVTTIIIQCDSTV